MSKYLSFHFNLNDPEAKSETIILNPSEINYLAHAFIKVPIYDDYDVKIGYKVSDDYIQQLSNNLYSVRINSTYHFLNGSSISWQYCFLNNKPNYFYPLNVINASNIIATTGEYFGKTGVVSLIASENGKRDITIGFNF
jgi:hypothetical protein